MGKQFRYKCSFVSPKSGEGYHFLENKIITVGEDGIILSVSDDDKDDAIDFSRYLTIPSFNDLHLHASQLDIRGIGCDRSLKDWFNDVLYKSENKYDTTDYYKTVNERLVYELWLNGIMNSSILTAVSLEPTIHLMNCIEASGISANIGKMNCDINETGKQRETLIDSLENTKLAIEHSKKLSDRITYSITPEFIPTCSTELMQELGKLAQDLDLPVQLHFAEGEFDSKHVRERYPGMSYLEVYDKFDLLLNNKSLVIHGISAEDKDYEIIKEKDLLLVHCASALSDNPSDRNFSLSEALEKGVRLGYASDIGGSSSLNPFHNMVSTRRYSNIISLERDEKPVSLLDVFTIMTKNSGSYFGNYGVIEPGYYFNVLMIEDELKELSIQDRFESFVYRGDVSRIKKRYHQGKLLELNKYEGE